MELTLSETELAFQAEARIFMTTVMPSSATSNPISVGSDVSRTMRILPGCTPMRIALTEPKPAGAAGEFAANWTGHGVSLGVSAQAPPETAKATSPVNA